MGLAVSVLMGLLVNEYFRGNACLYAVALHWGVAHGACARASQSVTLKGQCK